MWVTNPGRMGFDFIIILPLLLSHCCFSCVLGLGMSFYGGFQYLPDNGCSSASCNFGAFMWEDAHTLNSLYYVEIYPLSTRFDESFFFFFLTWMDVEFCLFTRSCDFLNINLFILIGGWFLSFLLLISCITLIDLQIFNHPFIPEINPDLLWCLFFLNIAEFWLPIFCLGFLHLYSSKILAYIP